MYGGLHDWLVSHDRTRKIGIWLEILRAPFVTGMDGLRFWWHLLKGGYDDEEF